MSSNIYNLSLEAENKMRALFIKLFLDEKGFKPQFKMILDKSYISTTYVWKHLSNTDISSGNQVQFQTINFRKRFYIMFQ